MERKEILISSLNEINLDYNDSDINKIDEYISILLEFNKKYNLVGTKSEHDILIRHIIDSLSIFIYTDLFRTSGGKGLRILDIGTGAGLPGILISIFLRNNQVYLMDKKSKAIEFLRKAVQKLNLMNIKIIDGNAEDLGHDNGLRESFDIVLTRAVGKFNIVCELALPFCKIGGKTVFYKSKKVHEEVEKYRNIIPILGGKIDKILEVKVPYLDEYRAFLSLLKVKSTLYKYPRKYVKILKMPLAE